jgi:hypothetical protein
VAVAVLTGPRRRWLPDLSRVALGGLASLAVVTLYFAAAGALRDFVDGFYVANAQYTTSTPLVENAARAWARTVNRFGASTWWFLAGMAAVLLLPLLSRHEAPRGGPIAAALRGLAAGGAAGLWWVLFRDYDSGQDLFTMLPLAAVGIAGAVVALGRRLPQRAALALPAVVAGLAVLSAVVYSVDARDQRLDGQRRSVERVLAVVPDATVVSFEAPQVLVLSGRENPVRHQMLGSGMHRYVDDTWPGGQPAFEASIIRDVRPELIAMGRSVHPNFVERFKGEYVAVGRGELEGRWLARRSLGKETLDELRRALR